MELEIRNTAGSILITAARFWEKTKTKPNCNFSDKKILRFWLDLQSYLYMFENALTLERKLQNWTAKYKNNMYFRTCLERSKLHGWQSFMHDKYLWADFLLFSEEIKLPYCTISPSINCAALILMYSNQHCSTEKPFWGIMLMCLSSCYCN